MTQRLFLAALLTASASAQDTGLYAPAPPANSAFVRVLSAPAATLGTQHISAKSGAASPYVVIPQGTLSVKLGTVSGKLKVEAGKFYSVFSAGGKLLLLVDQAAESRAKALLTVYNLSQHPSLDLKTADGKTTVLTGIKMNSSASRAVNGITVDLAAFVGAKSVGTVKGVKLERGDTYALVVTDSGLTVTQSTTKLK